RHTAEAYGRTLVKAAPEDEHVRVLGPAEAAIAVVRGRHRFRLLVKSPRAFDLSAYLRKWLANAPKARGNVRLEVDVDPQSFYSIDLAAAFAAVAGYHRPAVSVRRDVHRNAIVSLSLSFAIRASRHGARSVEAGRRRPRKKSLRNRPCRAQLGVRQGPLPMH